MQHDRPRAQGQANIPWPAGLTAGGDNCAVALEVIVAKVNGDRSLKSEQRVP